MSVTASVAAQQSTTRSRVDPTIAAPAHGRLVRVEAAMRGARPYPFSIVLLAFATVLVGAWGAIAPFVGPDFGFVADRSGAWQWSETSAVLALVPGAVALVVGIMTLRAASRVSYRRRADMGILGLVGAACGAWFVVGQYLWPVIDGRVFIVPSTPDHFMWKELCFAVGPGVVLVFCGAAFMGWAVRRQLAVVDAGHPVADAPMVTPSPAPMVTPSPAPMVTPSPAPQTGVMAAPASVAAAPPPSAPQAPLTGPSAGSEGASPPVSPI
jgi:hypothetical protein